MTIKEQLHKSATHKRGFDENCPACQDHRHLCWCGSGLTSFALYDARGIYVQQVCHRCNAKVRDRYRPEIFTDPNYWTDEPIDEE